jgi:F0F1-type ATP synthase beta subunit
MSQRPFQVAQVFAGYEGKLVSLKDTVRSFKEILSGTHDSLRESAFIYGTCSAFNSAFNNELPMFFKECFVFILGWYY